MGKGVGWVSALAEGGKLSFEVLLNLQGNPSHQETVMLNQFQVHPLPSPSLEHLPVGSQCPEVAVDVKTGKPEAGRLGADGGVGTSSVTLWRPLMSQETLA